MKITIGVSMPPQNGDMPQLRKAWEEADGMGVPLVSAEPVACASIGIRHVKASTWASPCGRVGWCDE